MSAPQDDDKRQKNEASTRPKGFEESVLRPSQELPQGVNVEVRGYDFNEGVDYNALLESYASTGFQATHFASAVNLVNKMVNSTWLLPKSASAIELVALSLFNVFFLPCWQIARKSVFPGGKDSDEFDDRELQETMCQLGLEHARRTGCTIFLAYTSNMITSGVREVVRFLVQHHLVSENAKPNFKCHN